MAEVVDEILLERIAVALERVADTAAALLDLQRNAIEELQQSNRRRISDLDGSQPATVLTLHTNPTEEPTV